MYFDKLYQLIFFYFEFLQFFFYFNFRKRTILFPFLERSAILLPVGSIVLDISMSWKLIPDPFIFHSLYICSLQKISNKLNFGLINIEKIWNLFLSLFSCLVFYEIRHVSFRCLKFSRGEWFTQPVSQPPATPILPYGETEH